MADERRTLQQLDAQDWGDPENAATGMIARCLRLRRTPLQALAPGDVRLLIGQQIGLRTLVPKALQMLSSDALLHSEYYPGDLLSALMRVERSHWRDYPEQLNETMELARAVASREVKIADECRAFLSANGS